MKNKFLNVAMVAFLAVSVVACTSSTQVNNSLSYDDPHAVSDPLEGVNRAIFSFNGFLDRIILKPVAQGYRYVLPPVVRDSVQSFLRNLSTPVTLVNEILQGDVSGAGNTTARFLVNSTAGIGGLVDVADDVGFEYEAEDFGQTLAVWGVGEGPYLVLPLLGPSNARDAVGSLVDAFSDPINVISYNADNEYIPLTRGGLAAIDTRARLIDPLDELKRSSIDYYASIRSVYKQFRDAQIADRVSDSLADHTSTAEIPDYEDY
jgi:phospholipid-binding lipoprotein MlaA